MEGSRARLPPHSISIQSSSADTRRTAASHSAPVLDDSGCIATSVRPCCVIGSPSARTSFLSIGTCHFFLPGDRSCHTVRVADARCSFPRWSTSLFASLPSPLASIGCFLASLPPLDSPSKVAWHLQMAMQGRRRSPCARATRATRLKWPSVSVTPSTVQLHPQIHRHAAWTETRCTLHTRERLLDPSFSTMLTRLEILLRDDPRKNESTNTLHAWSPSHAFVCV